MAFPVTTPTKANLDESTDSPASARSELATLVDLVAQIINSYAQVSGLCDLDASGKVPAARLPGGASSGVDADLLDGQEGAYYQSASNLNAGTLPAARFDNTSHGNRSGGSLHPAVTTSVNGFMTAADKTLFNSAPHTVANIGSGEGVLVLTANALQGKSLKVANTTNGNTGNYEGSTLLISSDSTSITITLRDDYDIV